MATPPEQEKKSQEALEERILYQWLAKARKEPPPIKKASSGGVPQASLMQVTREYQEKLRKLYASIREKNMRRPSVRIQPETTSVEMRLPEGLESQYLAQTVGGALRQALAEVCVSRPADPIEFIGLWLHRYADNQQRLHKTSSLNATVAKEVQEDALESMQKTELAREHQVMKLEEERRKRLYLERQREVELHLSPRLTPRRPLPTQSADNQNVGEPTADSSVTGSGSAVDEMKTGEAYLGTHTGQVQDVAHSPPPSKNDPEFQTETGPNNAGDVISINVPSVGLLSSEVVQRSRDGEVEEAERIEFQAEHAGGLQQDGIASQNNTSSLNAMSAERSLVVTDSTSDSLKEPMSLEASSLDTDRLEDSAAWGEEQQADMADLLGGPVGSQQHEDVNDKTGVETQSVAAASLEPQSDRDATQVTDELKITLNPDDTSGLYTIGEQDERSLSSALSGKRP